MDSDTIATGDITELPSLIGHDAVSVVKGKQRFEWPSVMMFQNSNSGCVKLTPKFVNDTENSLFDFKWADSIGELPAEWNNLIGYQEPNPKAKIIHYTAGIPCWPETKASPLAKLWMKELAYSVSTVTWEELMGKSVHRKIVEAM